MDTTLTLTGHDFEIFVDVNTATDVGPFDSLAEAHEYAWTWSGSVVVVYNP